MPIWLARTWWSDESLVGNYVREMVVVAGSLREAHDLVEAYRDPDPECRLEWVERITETDADVALDSAGRVIE